MQEEGRETLLLWYFKKLGAFLSDQADSCPKSLFHHEFAGMQNPAICTGEAVDVAARPQGSQIQDGNGLIVRLVHDQSSLEVHHLHPIGADF